MQGAPRKSWAYIEESWGETPEHSLKLKDELALAENLALTLRRVDKMQEAVQKQEGQLADLLEADGLQIDSAQIKDEIQKEARRGSASAVHPQCCITNCSCMLPGVFKKDSPKALGYQMWVGLG